MTSPRADHRRFTRVSHERADRLHLPCRMEPFRGLRTRLSLPSIQVSQVTTRSETDVVEQDDIPSDHDQRWVKSDRAFSHSSLLISAL
jgi:hypothetical protein